MSRPPINPDKSVAGIALDPKTLERVIPESKRPDGTVRKQIKIRPGYTPQEDVKRFRGTKQAQMDSNVLPKGHVVGWTPPPAASSSAQPLSKSAKKNAKRKEKRDEKKTEVVQENWDDDDDDAEPSAASKAADTKPSSDAKAAADTSADTLASNLEKLEVK